MTFDRARREALSVANADAPLGLDTWSDAMKATAETLARIGAEDSTVSSAARLAQIVQPVENEAAWTWRQALARVSTRDRATAAQEARTWVGLLTRAARRNADVDPRRQDLLSIIEREAVTSRVSPGATDLLQAVQRRRDALAYSAPALQHPLVAASMATYQIELIDLATEHLGRVSAPEGFDRAHVQELLEQSRERWTTARQHWHTNKVPYTESMMRIAQPLSVASHELAAVLPSQRFASSPAVLDALFTTDLAGQGLAARFAAGRRVRGLASLTPALEVAWSSYSRGIVQDAGTIPHRETLTRRVLETHSPTRTPEASVEEPASIPQGGDGSARFGVEVNADEVERFLSPTEVREYCRRRDAGVIAQAALDGDDDARQLAAGATQPELKRLVDDGRRAKAELVVSATSIVHGVTSRILYRDHDDAYQAATLGALEAATTFDPDRRGASWPGWVHTQAKWAMGAYMRKEITYREQVRVTDDVREPTRLHSDPVASRVLEGQVWPQMQALIRQLPEQEQLPMVLALGLNRNPDDPKPSAPELAAELGASESTYRRRVTSGMNHLRDLLVQEGHVPARGTSERLREVSRKLHERAMPAPEGEPVTSQRGLEPPAPHQGRSR